MGPGSWRRPFTSLFGSVIGAAGWILAIVGLVPLLTGPFDVWMFAPPFRMPFSGDEIRGPARGKADGDGHGLSAGVAAALSGAASMRGTNLGVRAA